MNTTNNNKDSQLISLAGQVTALRASGAKIVEASIDEENEIRLVVEEDSLFAGFNSHVPGLSSSLGPLESRLRASEPTLALRMAIAQMRVIDAGNSALDYARIGTSGSYENTAVWQQNESWANNLADTFSGLLDIDDESIRELADTIWWEAQSLIGHNFGYFTRQYFGAKPTGRIDTTHFTPASDLIESPVSAQYAESMLKRIEKLVEEMVEDSATA